VELSEITESTKVRPGEYIFHTPTNTVVLVGKFDFTSNHISAFHRGGLVNDEVKNFKKIGLTPKEYREHRATRCSGCKGTS
jgi:argonaute-like protein implicated in RNA metabolism and viral defense